MKTSPKLDVGCKILRIYQEFIWLIFNISFVWSFYVCFVFDFCLVEINQQAISKKLWILRLLRFQGGLGFFYFGVLFSI